MSEESPPNAPAPAAKNGKPGKILLALLLAGLAAWGGMRYLAGRGFEETDDAFLDARIVGVSPRVGGHLLAVHAKDNQEVKAGELLLEIDRRPYELVLQRAKEALAVARARVGASASNTLYAKAASDAGIDEAATGVERARAASLGAAEGTRVAESRVEAAQAQIKSAQAAIDQTQALILGVEAKTDLAGADLKRLTELRQKEFISAQALDQAAAYAKSAAAELEGAKAAASLALAQKEAALAAKKTAEAALVQARAAEIESLKAVEQAMARLGQARTSTQSAATARAQEEAVSAEIALAQTAVQQAELDLQYTRIVAPENGRVTKKTAEAGQYVSPGQTLMALVTTGPWVVANYKETQLTRIKPGQPATVKIDAYPDRTYNARVDSVQRGTGSRFSLLPAENATGNYVKVVQRLPVKLTFTETLPAELLLGPGMSVIPVIDTK